MSEQERDLMTETVRQTPPWVTTPEDIRSTTVRRFEFFPEDLEKMKNMTSREQWKFTADLVRKGRRYYPDEV